MTRKYKLAPVEFKDRLTRFTGSAYQHEHIVGDDLSFWMTDGCDFVRRAADARWLFDEILLNQLRPEVRKLRYQQWILWFDKDNGDKGCWVLRCDDMNDNTVLVQMIVDRDFLIDEITIWVIDGVAMLPGEY